MNKDDPGPDLNCDPTSTLTTRTSLIQLISKTQMNNVAMKCVIILIMESSKQAIMRIQKMPKSAQTIELNFKDTPLFFNKLILRKH